VGGGQSGVQVRVCARVCFEFRCACFRVLSFNCMRSLCLFAGSSDVCMFYGLESSG